MKTHMEKKEEQDRKWYLVDARDAVLGRLSSRIALLLSGKSKPRYTPHVDTGDFVVVINAKDVRLTGGKKEKKIYYRYSGYPGGLRRVTAGRLLETHPDRLILHAVKGMLPKNSLGRAMYKKLKVYGGPDHPHAAQKPEAITLTK
jgi:large subunit ribosomal protein L13